MSEPPLGTLLVFDDAPENLHVLNGPLPPFYYPVLAANNGESGLQIAASNVPSALILYVMMPGMNGYQVLKSLRNQPATADIPVIFLTSLSRPAEKERGLTLGMADYIAKPITPAVVLVRVRGRLQARQTRDWLKNQNVALKAEVARHMAENALIQKFSISHPGAGAWFLLGS